jgi:hypothetical protein
MISYTLYSSTQFGAVGCPRMASASATSASELAVAAYPGAGRRGRGGLPVDQDGDRHGLDATSAQSTFTTWCRRSPSW